MDDTDLEAAVADREAERVTDLERYEAGDYADLTDVVKPGTTESVDIGLGHLALGNCALGRAWLAAAVNGFFAMFEAGVDMALDFEKSVPATAFADLRFALLNALIAGDEETLQELLADVVERLEDVPPDRQEPPRHWAAYCETIVALLTDGERDPEAALARLREVADEGASDWGHVRTPAFEGIVTGDVEKVHEGLEAILTYHREEIVDKASTLPGKYVCHDAYGLLVLARRQGLDVEIESEYIPACVAESE